MPNRVELTAKLSDPLPGGSGPLQAPACCVRFLVGRYDRHQRKVEVHVLRSEGPIGPKVPGPAAYEMLGTLYLDSADFVRLGAALQVGCPESATLTDGWIAELADVLPGRIG